uniref:BTB domain-containing protein n=1 Tax=Glossina morsitans morsitans TaxID=37546 RepID=A0A1B0EU57_GLOMM
MSAIEVFRNSTYCDLLETSLGQIHPYQQHNCFMLDAEGESVHICRTLLKVASPYFASIRNSDIKGALEELINSRKIDICTLKEFTCYTRTGMIRISKDNVQSVLSMSERFQIDWIKDKCCRFLKQRFNHTNCFSIRKIAEKHSCKELHNYAYNYILRRFEKLTGSQEFLLLSLDEIEKLIQDEDLCVKSEKSVLQAVMNWIKHSPEKRNIHLGRLMNCVRLHSLDMQFIIDYVINEPLITNDPFCMKLILETLKHSLANDPKAKRGRSKARNGTKYLRFVKGLTGE